MLRTLGIGVVLLACALAPLGCQGGDGKAASETGKRESTGTAAAAVVTGPHAAVSSQPICTPNDLAPCAAEQPISDRCLTLYQACGRYLDIVEHYRTEQLPDLRQWYYLGVAYHGLYLRNRSAAARCQFGEAARLALLQYLRESSKDGGYNDQRIFQQSYHATKLLESVKDIAGCQSDGVTYSELYTTTLAHGREIAEGLFLGDPPPGPLATAVATTKADMQTAIRGFISKAANIESQLALRRTAMDQSDTRVNSIWVGLTRDFGATGSKTDTNGTKPVIASLALPAGGSPFRAQMSLYTGSSGIEQHTKDVLASLNQAMGTAKISDYENARSTLVGYARDAQAASATAIVRAQAADVNSSILALRAKTPALRATSTTAYFQDIKAKWKSYGTQIGACTQPPTPWYCK